MISVVIVTHNSSEVILPCLKSITDSVISDLGIQIVVYDNASSDSTCDLVSSWIEKLCIRNFSARLICSSRNQGFAAANNKAVEYADRDILLILNPDTLVHQGTIEQCYRLLVTSREIGAVGCRLVLLTGEIDKACKRSFPTLWNSFCRFFGLSHFRPKSRIFSSYNLNYVPDNSLCKVPCISGAFMMVRRNTFDRVGGFDKDFFMYGEDIDFCYRLKEDGLSVFYCGTASTTHIKGGNGGKRSSKSLRHFYTSMVVYYKKHHSRLGLPVAVIGVYMVMYIHLVCFYIKLFGRGLFNFRLASNFTVRR